MIFAGDDAWEFENRCFDDRAEIRPPRAGSEWYGQDAQYKGLKPAYRDNGDGTVTDLHTGLMWQADPGEKRTYAATVGDVSRCRTGGHRDWRLPNAKELQSLVDYTRSPDATDSPAIDPVFHCTEIQNEGGGKDYGHYWTGTIHRNPRGGQHAVTFAFGRAPGHMRGRWMDVHGAGAQRSDPKTGDIQFPRGHGPQGDARRVDNYIRLVRGVQ